MASESREPLRCVGEVLRTLEPSHGEILRAVGVLEGQLASLVSALNQQSSDRSQLEQRINKLETRNGQIMLIGAIAVVIAPMLWGEISHRMRDSANPVPAKVHQAP